MGLGLLSLFSSPLFFNVRILLFCELRSGFSLFNCISSIFACFFLDHLFSLLCSSRCWSISSLINTGRIGNTTSREMSNGSFDIDSFATMLLNSLECDSQDLFNSIDDVTFHQFVLP